jgi:thiol-disulfide isomerase/thioredoxin
LALLALLISACDRRSDAPPTAPEPSPAVERAAGRLDRSRAGTPAPDTQFEGPDGAPASFAEFRGKPLLVNLWATWCAPCVAEMPTLDALAAAEPAIHVLVLSQDLNGQEKVNAFFEQRAFKKLEPYIDPELKLMGALEVQSLPTTILYDAAGRELWRLTGGENWRGARAGRLIAEARKS